MLYPRDRGLRPADHAGLDLPRARALPAGERIRGGTALGPSRTPALAVPLRLDRQGARPPLGAALPAQIRRADEAGRVIIVFRTARVLYASNCSQTPSTYWLGSLQGRSPSSKLREILGNFQGQAKDRHEGMARHGARGGRGYRRPACR